MCILHYTKILLLYFQRNTFISKKDVRCNLRKLEKNINNYIEETFFKIKQN